MKQHDPVAVDGVVGVVEITDSDSFVSKHEYLVQYKNKIKQDSIFEDFRI